MSFIYITLNYLTLHVYEFHLCQCLDFQYHYLRNPFLMADQISF